MVKLIVGRWLELDLNRAQRYAYVRVGRWDWCISE